MGTTVGVAGAGRTEHTSMKAKGTGPARDGGMLAVGSLRANALPVLPSLYSSTISSSTYAADAISDITAIHHIACNDETNRRFTCVTRGYWRCFCGQRGRRTILANAIINVQHNNMTPLWDVWAAGGRGTLELGQTRLRGTRAFCLFRVLYGCGCAAALPGLLRALVGLIVYVLFHA